MKLLERFGPIILVLVSLGIACLFGYVATTRKLTSLESFFWQFLSLLIGLIGSFIFGRRAAQETVREILRSHARPAFRRLLSLHLGLQRQSIAIESLQNTELLEDYRRTLAELTGLVYMQVLTVVDALGDWEDVVPEEAEVLKKKLSADRPTEDWQ